MSLFYFVARYGPWHVFLIGADLLWSAAIKKNILRTIRVTVLQLIASMLFKLLNLIKMIIMIRFSMF